MGNQIHNISKGRFNELHDRVDGNDPANAVLVLGLLSAAETDATLLDYDDWGALIGAAGNTETIATNYGRKILADADIGVSTVDDTNDRREADIPDQVFSSLGNGTNTALAKAILGYDSDSTVGTDVNIVPVGHFDAVLSSTNGGDVTLQVNAAGYGRAA